MSTADFQQQRVYDYEAAVVEPIAHFLLSRDDIRALVDRMCRLTGTPVPDIRFLGSTTIPCKAVVGPGVYRIDIADWGRTPPVVLHETAHLAQYADLAGRRELMARNHHGPVFVRLAIDIYSAFMDVDLDVLEKLATAHGVVFAPRRVNTTNFTSVSF
ncbi:hypothetical protein [Methylorubrum extorquens]|jgi:hypothetical protein|uniref:Uncharacterized protein n=1 Tax=Methylorubrum extorquens (strain ATCC 14718 / DSM 1338 / JCM 2805 / NCIMB 9133 / AM1) TaxID=272630 RepID=C5B4Q3_METEA|nr:hypothetical protein [Methylorubrum extorquens]ACS43435.1 hypothetical protein MexAM1_META2p0588 [Methylorubrum extorquens AM1]MCP1545472.1 hypothetical protein [Methylorubrum extorquens]MCP1591423.1 hypothetical protein [Methylorubrum extorquens]